MGGVVRTYADALGMPIQTLAIRQVTDKKRENSLVHSLAPLLLLLLFLNKETIRG